MKRCAISWSRKSGICDWTGVARLTKTVVGTMQALPKKGTKKGGRKRGAYGEQRLEGSLESSTRNVGGKERRINGPVQLRWRWERRNQQNTQEGRWEERTRLNLVASPDGG